MQHALQDIESSFLEETCWGGGVNIIRRQMHIKDKDLKGVGSVGCLPLFSCQELYNFMSFSASPSDQVRLHWADGCGWRLRVPEPSDHWAPYSNLPGFMASCIPSRKQNMSNSYLAVSMAGRVSEMLLVMMVMQMMMSVQESLQHANTCSYFPPTHVLIVRVSS